MKSCDQSSYSNNNNNQQYPYDDDDNDIRIMSLLVVPLHIIDHGSVLYLILLQILFYNQQYVYNQSYNNNNNINGVADNDMTPTITVKTISYESYTDALNNSIDGASNATTPVITESTKEYALPSFNI